MKNNIINELRFASKKKKNAVLGYIYCDYLLDMFEEIESLNVEIKELNYLLLKQFERPYAKKWLEEQRENYKKEHPDTDTELGYPDSETIYKEYYKLNNIINELEKWLEQKYAIVKSNSIIEPNNPEWYIKWNERKIVLDKLQELKGSESNE